MTDTTPYCNIEVATPPAKPGDAVRRTGALILKIPPNANLQQVISILNRNFQALSPSTPKPSGRTTATTKKSNELKKTQWEEVTRTLKIVRVENPNDSTQFVDVEQINSLTMRDRKTGEVWKWTR